VRPPGKPVLPFAAPLCAGCAINQCAERQTDVACDDSPPHAAVVDVMAPDRLGHFMSLAEAPAAFTQAAPLPRIPAYTAVLPVRREALVAIPRLTARSVGFTFGDYLQLIRAAERGDRSVREHLKLGDRQIVVLGSDAHRKCVSYFYRWPELLAMIERHPPNLLVPPELGVFERDKPIVRYLHQRTGQNMYGDLANRGIGAVAPFGWSRMSDIRLMAEWVRVYEIPGLFIDVQAWGQRGLDELLDDLAQVRQLFPRRFTWLVNGVVRVDVWRRLQAVLGTVRLSSSGVFHEARNHRMFSYDGANDVRKIYTGQPVYAVIVESIYALTRAAADVLEPPRQPVPVVHLRPQGIRPPARVR
jgi:hypothetical protein